MLSGNTDTPTSTSHAIRLPFSRTMSSSSSNISLSDIPQSLNVVLCGYQRKLKTMKKKFFVIYADTPEKSARIEYYDSDKKFKNSLKNSGSTIQAKRSIVLRNCFNINKRSDTKHKYVIALYTKDDCFCIVFNDEHEMDNWLRILLSLQRGEDCDGEPPKPTFEHVWEVYVQRKGLGENYGILGNYRLCITDKTLAMVRIGPPTVSGSGERRVEHVEFSLSFIRRCGASHKYFYLEVGRQSVTGAGEIWMETLDPIIALNMETTILKSASNKEDSFRGRSSSVNAASKPVSQMSRRQTHTGGQKPTNFANIGEDQNSPHSSNAMNSDTCTTPNNNPCVQNQNLSNTKMANQQHNQEKSAAPGNAMSSPPPISSIRRTRTKLSSDSPKPLHLPPHSIHSVSYYSAEISSSKDNANSSITRERCDSLPSRNRTTSETSAHQQISMPPPRTIPSSLSSRPHSVSGINYIQPCPPLSSTASDGSSLSCIGSSDEADSFVGSLNQRHFIHGYQRSFDDARHNSLSLPISQSARRGSPLNSSLDESNYMDMSMSSQMSNPSTSPPNHSSLNDGYIPMSPVVDFARGRTHTGSSGTHSRTSSITEDVTDGYVPMGPPQTHEEYVDMEATSRTRSIGGDMSSAASSCSEITSGTPSTDMRFSEYHLEKVIARFTPSEEDEERPMRTYSVGSRLEHNKRKLRVDMLSQENNAMNSRMRAYSVGSRANKVPRSEMYKGSSTTNSGQIIQTAPFISNNFAQEHQTSNNNINNNFSNSSVVKKNLNNTNNNNNNNNTKHTGKKSTSAPMLVNKSHGSFDPIMDDLMEIDYGDIYNSSTPLKKPISLPQKNNEDYMDMTPCNNNNTSQTPTSEVCDYLDMRPGNGIVKSSPIKINYSKNSGNNNNNNNNYVDMSPRTKSVTAIKVPSAQHETKTRSDSNDMIVASAPEGYMEMSWGMSESKNTSILSEKIDSNEYMNMDFGPSIIQANSNIKTDKFEPKTSNKSTVIPNFLPLKSSNSGSVAFSPNKNLIRPRCDSKDSGIFPFSPGSPERTIISSMQCVSELDEKEDEAIEMSEPERHVTTQLEDLSNNYAFMSIDQQELQKQSILDKEAVMKKSTVNLILTTSTGTRTTATITSTTKCTEFPDYVNCAPAINQCTSNKSSTKTQADDGDYAIMNPAITRKTSTNIDGVTTIPPLSTKKSVLLTNSLMGFKPITSTQDEILLSQKKCSQSPKSTMNRCSDRDFLPTPLFTTDSTNELLPSQRAVISSRPNSVNSDKINNKTARPNSANSDRLSLASTPALSTSVAQSDIKIHTSPTSSVTSLNEQNLLTSSRPPSVVSERELHYASLDLPVISPPDTISAKKTSNIIDPKLSGENVSGETTNASLLNEFAVEFAGTRNNSNNNNNASNDVVMNQQNPTATFMYAQIDFGTQSRT